MIRPDRSAVAGLLGALLLALGCATPSEWPYQDWQKPDATEEDFQREHADCLQQATVPAPISVRGNTMATLVDEDLFWACMHAAGWRPDR